ncbi:MAG TPA: flagellar biosynthesis protein FlhB [Steroidobacteraceae bacterium]|nr:flagellar biosynthesis protein FlhB [Steroidobacteraceae bacterium]
MADDQDQDQRTESATPRRLEEARKRGQVPRSRDLNSAAVLLSGGIGLYALGGLLGGQLLALMRDCLRFSRTEAMADGQMTAAFADAAWQALLACAPLLGLLLVAALVAPLAIGGWNFSTEALAPKWDRLDPISGIKRVFSVRGLAELAKALARFAVVALVTCIVLWTRADELLQLGREPLQQAIGHSLRLVGFALLALSGSLVLIAFIDVPLTLWQHFRGLRMTKEEVRQEHKETEGNPELKGHIRSRQQALARRRMMQDVPKADVIVTNPTHYAVALRYDDTKMRAPVVVAKGQDLIALKIREVAGAHGVPILEAPPLARALHKHCELGDAIPAQLYTAVAQVLAYVYQLRAARRSGAPLPVAPTIDYVEPT